MGIKKKRQIVLGIDPSIRSTGICIVGEKGKILFWENIYYRDRKVNVYQLINSVNKESPKELEVLKEEFRGHIVAKRILELIKKYNVTQIAMEDYAFAVSDGKTFNIGEFVGMIKYQLAANNHNYELVSPTSLKLYTTGNGNAGKEMMLANIMLKYSHNFQSDDVNDAFALAIMKYELGDKLSSFITKKGMAEFKKVLSKVS